MTAQYTKDALDAPHTQREIGRAAETAEPIPCDLQAGNTPLSAVDNLRPSGDMVSLDAAIAALHASPHLKYGSAAYIAADILRDVQAAPSKTDLARAQAQKEDANWTTAKDYWKDRAEKAEAEVERLKSRPDAPVGGPLTLTYRNYRGEVAERTITPRGVWFGSTDWHPEPQWILTAFDHEKRADRDFALKDFGGTTAKPLLDLADKIEAEEREAASWDGPDPRGPLAMGYAFTFIKRLRAEARILAAAERGAT